MIKAPIVELSEGVDSVIEALQELPGIVSERLVRHPAADMIISGLAVGGSMATGSRAAASAGGAYFLASIVNTVYRDTSIAYEVLNAVHNVAREVVQSDFGQALARTIR